MKHFIIVAFSVLAGMAATYAQSPPLESETEIKNRAIKMDPFSPISGKLTFGYEQNVYKGINIDVDAGIIGPSVFNIGKNAAGFFVEAGPRFYSSPDYYTSDMKRYSDFQGFYLQPAVAFTIYSYGNNPDDVTIFGDIASGTQRAGTITFSLGKQWVMGGLAIIDLNMGLGYGFVSNNDLYFNYSHIGRTFVATSGLSVGILTK